MPSESQHHTRSLTCQSPDTTCHLEDNIIPDLWPGSLQAWHAIWELTSHQISDPALSRHGMPSGSQHHTRSGDPPVSRHVSIVNQKCFSQLRHLNNLTPGQLHLFIWRHMPECTGTINRPTAVKSLRRIRRLLDYIVNISFSSMP